MRRSNLLRAGRLTAFRRSTFNCWRSATTSASSDPLDRKRSRSIHLSRFKSSNTRRSSPDSDHQAKWTEFATATGTVLPLQGRSKRCMRSRPTYLRSCGKSWTGFTIGPTPISRPGWRHCLQAARSERLCGLRFKGNECEDAITVDPFQCATTACPEDLPLLASSLCHGDHQQSCPGLPPERGGMPLAGEQIEARSRQDLMA